MIIEMPMRLVSEANRRDHWAAKAKRVQQQRTRAWAEVLEAKAKLPKGHWLRRNGAPMTITLIRIAPKGITDNDNLCSSFKAVRDGVAQALGIDDGSSSICWVYRQEKGKPRKYALRVQIEKYIPPYERESCLSPEARAEQLAEVRAKKYKMRNLGRETGVED